MKRFTCLVLALFFAHLGFSQSFQEASPVYQDVKAHKDAGKIFQGVAVFEKITSGEVVSRTVIQDKIELKPDFQKMIQTIQESPAEITFTLPGLDGNPLELELVKSNLLAEGFIVNTDAGIFDYDPSQSLHYRGIVKGDEHSLVAISILNDEVMGFVNSEGTGSLSLGRIDDPQADGRHILYSVADLDIPNEFSCSMEDLPFTEEELHRQEHTAKSRNTGDCVQIYVEADKDVYQANNSDETATINYITGLFNQVSTLYSNESINTTVSEIFIWTNRIKYKGGGASTYLSKFQGQRGGGFNGDLGILLNMNSSAGGIAAGFSGICNGNAANSLSYAGITSSYNQVPAYSWTVMVCTHELGHLFGSRHTHACVWNGNNTAIDGCAGQTEGTCALPGYPTGGGTIMSYCHLQSVGINFSKGFGSASQGGPDQPGDVIRGSVANGSCLGSSCGGSGGPSCFDGILNNGETDIDCGGPNCAACPTCNDNIQNGQETGVDCGGPDCPACQGGSCDEPTGLVATNIKPKRAKLNWGSVSAAVNYTVNIKTTSATSWSTATTSNTSITATSLSNGTTYEWRVMTNCSGSSSGWSTTCTFTAGNSGSGACGGGALVFALGDELTVYPNPANQQLQVDLPQMLEEDARLYLIDMYGQLVVDRKLGAGTTSTQLDLSATAVGIYLLKVQTAEKEWMEKVVVER